MKNQLLIAFASLLIGCAPQPKPYTVVGEVDPSLNGEVVRLRDYHRDNKVVAEARVEDGRFCFEGKMLGDSIYRLELGRSSANIILEGGVDLVVDFKTRGAVGSKKNQIKNEYEAAVEAAFSEAAKVNARLLADTTSSQEELDAKRTAYFMQLRQTMMEQAKTFVVANADNAAGAYILWNYFTSNTLSPDEFDALYALAGDYIRNFAPIQAHVEDMNAIRRTSSGKMFTDFAVEQGNPDGSTARLSDYVGKGKYVLVDFWASWCVPCREEIPFIRKVWTKYHGERFEVVGVAVRDARKATERAIRELDLQWPQILNAQGVPSELYGFDGIPFLILFGPDGTIIERNLRGDRILEAVEEVLEGNE